MRSMVSGVSGLRVHQARMDVIANNISNVNTVGFKSSRVLFDEVFSQTVSSASGASDSTGRGGVNPMQVGLGASVSSIGRIMTPGAAQRTDNPMDLMIEGGGFFIVGDGSGTFFTRAGALDLDQEGNLVISNGMKVMGWESVPDPDNPGQSMVQRGPVQPINISGDKMSAPPSATENVRFQGNLDTSTDGPITMTKSFFDSLGNQYTMDVEFEFNADAGNWQVRIGPNAYLGGDKDRAVENIITPGPGVADNILTMTITFDTSGRLESVNGVNVDAENFTMPTISLNSDNLVPAADIGDGGDINLDFSQVTQYGNSRSTVTSRTLDGGSAGELDGLSVGQDGVIRGQYTNGQIRVLGQIPVAEFLNPAGLESVGGNLFRATVNSGDFDGLGTGGLLRSGALEMSNVDLSSEFTDMIITQRGFQASSRLITTSDDMIQELVNLKR